MKLSLLMALAIGFTPLAFGQELSPVRVEQTTKLIEIGYYQVRYQIFGQEMVNMGLGWSGHFEPVAGISYVPWREQDGIPTLLMHCPWRRGGGSTFADYRLLLPKGAKAKFVFGFAMMRDKDVQKGSDGVTFIVLINGDEKFKKHVKSDKWEWHEIDLSTLSGKEFVLTLAVNAGPKNDAGWDYSLWGDPKILVEGVRKKMRFPKVRRETLEGLSNDHRLGVKPSTRYTHKNFSRQIGDATFSFVYDGEDCEIRYIVKPRREVFPAFVEVWIDDAPKLIAYANGRVEGEKGVAKVIDAKALSFAKDKLTVSYSFRCNGKDFNGKSTFWIEGKTLLCHFTSNGGWISHINFGVPIAELRRYITVPYLFATHLYYLPAQSAFASVFTDFTQSNGSYLDGSSVIYERKTDGRRNDVNEVCLFTVSYEFPEVLRNIPWEPSPYFGEISDRIVFDIWGGHLLRDAEWVRELSTYGITRAIMLKHVWQRYGYDSHLPTTVPANEQLGGDEGAIALSKACRDAGWLFALHENYIDFYPKSHEWNEREVALNPDGTMRKAWFNEGTGEQSYAYKNWAMAKYARIYSNEIHRRYGTTAAFYDVNSCAPPWLHLDCDANEPDAAMLAGRMKGNLELFKVGREAHKGPLFGEGWQHFWWAGLVDGVEAQVDGKEWAPWLLDFDLLKIHVQQVNHGMGYWGRWQDDPEGYWYGLPSPEKLDKYRAMEIAFGHAGFVPTELWHAIDWVLKEYYLVRPIQARYCASKVRRILYGIGKDKKLVPSSIAIAMNEPIESVFVEYESGLRIWANSGELWGVDFNARKRLLPQFGFWAIAEGLEAFTAIDEKSGMIVDYCRDLTGKPKPFIFANGRSFPPSIEAICDVEPSVKVERIGGRRFRITYFFKVGRRNLAEITGRDLIVFVHFINFAVSKRQDGIVFQHDHKPKESTKNWQENSTIVDGPYEVVVPTDLPDEKYEIRLGLYDTLGRVRLKGADDGSMRYRVGTIVVEGEMVSFEPITVKEPPSLKGRVNFKQILIDFGEVITSGMVIVTPENGSISVIVHPRDEIFEIGLRLNRVAETFGIKGNFKGVNQAIVLDKNGKILGDVELKPKLDLVWFKTIVNGAKYVINLK
ncbi:MAG: hypothetical protein RMK18_07100 [Armatimonadota bacterium]|nr:hypothetical protein [Armatimonadota bacterium]MDW8025616.1 hypothetical protein [Armatimonadota bacterium]